MNRQTAYVLLIVIAALLFGGGVKYAQLGASRQTPQVMPAGTAAGQMGVTDSSSTFGGGRDGTGSSSREIVVHVTGAVERPGVYRLAEGARVNDALQMAGTGPGANLDLINLAAVLRDGQKVTVPLQGEDPPPTGAGGRGSAGFDGSPGSSAVTAGSASAEVLVNINTAGLAELDSLPGIGPALAQRIIDYREKNGLFRVPEDITNVSGIGEAKYNQLMDLISVD